MHPTPQCPVCGSSNTVRDELLSGERSWRCRDCGHEWKPEPWRAEEDVLPER
jgi:transposase-like protein